ncbi:hypothetical protein C807_02824 [Lachnospiraceae bacterium 28-4]|nr:hypothetical protein C807_02824 [Lachnospiraceae bacterium 28-4]
MRKLKDGIAEEINDPLLRYGREIANLGNTVIYWEPHAWQRGIVKRWSCWLGSSGFKGLILSTVRNSYVRADSYIKNKKKAVWEFIFGLGENEKEKGSSCRGWEEIVIKFEDLKKMPREMLTNLCERLHISFDESLMQSTIHGNTVFYRGITGFDLKPVYNLYEEYFTSFHFIQGVFRGKLWQMRFKEIMNKDEPF